MTKMIGSEINTVDFEQIDLSLSDAEWDFCGVTHERQIVRAIVVDGDNNFYFVRVDRDDDFGKAKYIETAGGGVEDGEDLESAIRRELFEELGATVDVVCKLGVVRDYYNRIKRRNINNYYLCQVKSLGQRHLTEDEARCFHLSTVKLTYESALAEYEKGMSTRIGRLVAARELPILNLAGRILTQD